MIAALGECLPTPKARSHIVAVYIKPSGKILRVFLGQSVDVDNKVKACMQKTLAGTTIPFTLPKAGFVEWRFMKKGDSISIKVRRPK